MQVEVNKWSAELGGHTRTGMEDNLKVGKDRLAASNAELVKLAVEAASAHDRRPATPAEARQILGLRAVS